MGLLDRLFGRTEQATATHEAAAPAECAHGDLAPRWDNAEDMGKQDAISGYACRGCGREFTRAEADRIDARPGTRLKETLGGS